MKPEYLGLSLYLREHPILDKRISEKIKYLNVLEYFINSILPEDEFVQSLFLLYKNKFEVGEEYFYKEEDIVKVCNNIAGLRVLNFKLVNYRHDLFFDCFFIITFFNESMSEILLSKMKKIFKKRYHYAIDDVYMSIYHNKKVDFKNFDNKIRYWFENKEFMNKHLKTFLITANMSAGKSTLINSLIGKKINKTQNQACTAKIHYIFNKSFEDSFTSSVDGSINLDASYQELSVDNEDNLSENIFVGSYFNSVLFKESRICFIDTPGVNSYLNTDHKEVTKKTIENTNYDNLIYVLDGTNIGTDDDIRHLEYVSKNAKYKNIIFVINKLDKFKIKDDSISECIEKVKKDVYDIGFLNALVYPVSAYAGLLAKKKIFGLELTEDEIDELELYLRKFKKDEYDFSKYYKNWIGICYDDLREKTIKDEYELLYYKSGLAFLEKAIIETGKKV